MLFYDTTTQDKRNYGPAPNKLLSDSTNMMTITTSSKFNKCSRHVEAELW